MQRIILAALASLALTAPAAELRLNFSEFAPGTTPAGFTNLLAGGGPPGDWRIVMDAVPPLLAPLSEQAPVVTRRPVLGQVSADATDERFPLFVYAGETFGDFTFRTRFKIVSGQTEQMAGVAFRLQDEKNFYVVRANAKDRNIRFYKVVGGLRSAPIGPSLDVPAGAWHELKIECKGTVIRAWLNGHEAIPAINDTSFSAGRIAFWTKSDSVSYFTDAVMDYTPRVPLAQKMVREMMEQFPRILALQVFAPGADGNDTVIIGSKDEAELGRPGGKYELEVLRDGKFFSSRNKSYAAIVMPLRDHNGEIAAAVRVHLNTFPGQTEQNALARATPIVKEMQARLQMSHDRLR